MTDRYGNGTAKCKSRTSHFVEFFELYEYKGESGCVFARSQLAVGSRVLTLGRETRQWKHVTLRVNVRVPQIPAHVSLDVIRNFSEYAISNVPTNLELN